MHPKLNGLVVGDDPTTWAAAGFALADGRFGVGGVAVRLAGSAGDRGVLGWSLEPPAAGPVDGLAPADAGGPVAAGPHPNGALALDHVVVGTSDLERTTAALGALGITPRRTVSGERGGRDALFRFFLLGTCVLEVIGPREPTGSGRPARFWGMAFAVADLEETVALLDGRCGAPHDAVQPGRRIATLRHQETGISVPVAFMTPRH